MNSNAAAFRWFKRGPFHHGQEMETQPKFHLNYIYIPSVVMESHQLPKSVVIVQMQVVSNVSNRELSRRETLRNKRA